MQSDWRSTDGSGNFCGGFEIVAFAVHRQGGRVAIEWPRACTYWREPAVKRLELQLGLDHAEFDGCRFGLEALQTANRSRSPGH